MPSPDEKHPVIAGFIALISVTAAVGVIVAVAAAFGTHLVRANGAGDSATANDGPSLVVPLPKPTHKQTGPLLTLSTGPGDSSYGHTSSSPTHHSSPKASKRLSLSASVVSATAMQQFQISGTYQGGEGHIVRLQRRMKGSGWTDFGIPDMDVQGGQFSTSVQTGHSGANYFRVKDVDTGKVSNVVKVMIG